MDMNLEAILYDAVYVVIFLCCIIFAANRGAFRAVAGIAGTIGGAALGWAFNTPVSAVIARWLQPLAIKLFGHDSVMALTIRAGKLDIPPELQALVDKAGDVAGDAVEAARAALADGLAGFISERIAPLLAFLLIFLAVKLAVSLVCTLLSLDIPILSTLNQWVGALFGAVSGALILLVLTWAVWHFAPDLGLPVLSREALASSRIGGFVCRLFS